MKDYVLLLVTGLAYLLILTKVNGEETPTRCAAYCHQTRGHQRYFFCPDDDESDEEDAEFCCGTRYDRYCCNNETLDISDLYPDDEYCTFSLSIYHWQFLLGVMGVLVMLVVIAACCCQCCTHKTNWENARGRRPSHRSHRTDTTLSTIELEGSPPPPEFFDPSHPFAFVPPEYDSLPKDPPPYTEIFGMGGSTNVAFNSDERTQENRERSNSNTNEAVPPPPPPPSYQDHLRSEIPNNQSSTNTTQRTSVQNRANLTPSPDSSARRVSFSTSGLVIPRSSEVSSCSTQTSNSSPPPTTNSCNGTNTEEQPENISTERSITQVVAVNDTQPRETILMQDLAERGVLHAGEAEVPLPEVEGQRHTGSQC